MLTIENNIKSIMVPQGKWQIDLYGLENFEHEGATHSKHKVKTLTHDTGADKASDRNDCIDVPKSHRGRVNSIMFTNSLMEEGELIPIPED